MTPSKRLALTAALLALPALGGCAHHQHHPPHGGADAAARGGPARSVTVPAGAESAKPRDSVKLVQEPGLTVVAITLRGGAGLPEHHSPAPVTIQALAGSGTVVMKSGERLPVGPGQFVYLPPFAPHAVESSGAGELVLLVTHAGNPEERHP